MKKLRAVGVVGVVLIHKTEMASYGWEVVRNSWGGESSLLRDDKDPKLKSAGWIQLEVARKLARAAGKDLDKMLQEADSAALNRWNCRSRERDHCEQGPRICFKKRSGPGERI